MRRIASPREALRSTMVALQPLPRSERLGRVSLWTMYYFSALIVPLVADAARTGRVPASAIDDLLCERDADGNVVGFVPRDGAPEGRGFDTLVDDHLAIAVATCGQLAGFPARVAWSNASVVIDYAIEDARATGDAHALRQAEALIAGDRHPMLAKPYRAGLPRVRRVCCLRYLLPGGTLCPGLCPKTTAPLSTPCPQDEEAYLLGKENPGDSSCRFADRARSPP